jgi:2-oxo-hept-3-ene-1,7-dioate hydratase
LTASDADRVRGGLEAQFEALARRRAEGAELIGWKIGLNVPAVQQHLGIVKPVVGHLTSAARVEPGSTHSVAGTTRAGVEPEYAIHVGAGGTIGSLGPAIEIVDLDPALDTLDAILGRNVFHCGVVLGPPVEGAGPADLEELTATVRRNGEIAEQAGFADTGEGPDRVLETVSERLALVGEELREGQVVIAGSLTPIVLVEPGDSIEVDLGPLGGLALEVA